MKIERTSEKLDFSSFFGHSKIYIYIYDKKKEDKREPSWNTQKK